MWSHKNRTLLVLGIPLGVAFLAFAYSKQSTRQPVDAVVNHNMATKTAHVSAATSTTSANNTSKESLRASPTIRPTSVPTAVPTDAPIAHSARPLDPTKPLAVVHIGPHKTASTDLQSFLFHYKQDFQLDGYEIPLFPGDWTGHKNHANIGFCFQSPDSNALIPKRYNHSTCNETLASWDSFLAEQANHSKSILVSTEELARTSVRVGDFLQSMEPYYHQIVILVVYRRYYEWLHSFYNEIAKQMTNIVDRPTFVEWMQGYNSSPQIKALLDEYTSPLTKTYASQNNSVTSIRIYNLHDTSQTMEASMVCKPIPHAKKSCQTAKKRKVATQKNPSKSFDVDFILKEAHQRGIIKINLENNKLRKQFRQLQVAISKLLWDDPILKDNLPRVCLSQDMQTELYNMSVYYEQELLPQQWLVSPQGLEALKQNFQLDATTKLCSLDTKSLNLTQSPWKQIFANKGKTN